MLLMRIAIRWMFSGFKRSFEASFFGPMRPHCVAGLLDRGNQPHLVVESIRLEMKRRRCSTALVPADGAEGAAMR